MSDAFSSQGFICHDHRQGVRVTVPASKRPATFRTTAAAAALTAALASGAVIAAAPASAATAPAAASALVPAVASPAVIKKTPPTISGAFETGQKLTANRGTWTWDAKIKYQWYGPKHTPIPGATTKYLRIPDGVTAISLEVTGSMAGKTSTTVATKETPVKTDLNSVRPGPIAFYYTGVTRDGGPEVGELLLGNKGTWSTYDLHYRWYRNGQPIPGAWRSKHHLQTADIGALITFGVTAYKEGYKARSGVWRIRR